MIKKTCRKSVALIVALVLAFAALALIGCNNDDNNSPPEENLDGQVDVIVFMGQSNMGGRGDASLSVKCGAGHGYEFRAVTDPTKLYDLSEPFGKYENNNGINDGDGEKKTGGLTSAFVEAYYAETGVPVVGVSASQGGTNSEEWQLGNGLLDEAQRRLNLCLDYMSSQDVFTVRHIYIVWLQGEADAGRQTSLEVYSQRMENVFAAMEEAGAEQMFVIGIGSYIEEVNAEYKKRYREFGVLQQTMCAQSENMTFVSKKLADIPEKYMHRNNHFLQPAYNVVGYDAGKNAAYYVKTGKAPECLPYADGEEFTIPGVEGELE